MKKDTDLENILFSKESIDTMIKKKMESEIKAESANQTLPKTKIITDIKEVPKPLIFSKKTVYKVFNRENKTISYINGVQAEAYAVMQKSLYEKLRNGEADAFYSENMYITFEKCKV